jgi:hypothetical protein
LAFQSLQPILLPTPGVEVLKNSTRHTSRDSILW